MRYNVTSTGSFKLMSQVIFPGLQGSHLNHYSHWHMAARTGWKHLYPALCRQWLRWSLQISPTTACTNAWSQLPLPSGSATWEPQRKKCSFQKTNTKFCGNIRNGQEIEIEEQTEALFCRRAPKSSRTYKWPLWFHVSADSFVTVRRLARLKSQIAICESQRGVYGSSSDHMNHQQQQGSRKSNGSSWRKQSAAWCQLKWQRVSAPHHKFVFPYSCC